MTDQLNSQLSAFVDEALSEAESELLVRRLCRDAQLRETLARYSLIGDIVRGDLAVPASGSFARSVMMAVDGQPMPQVEAAGPAQPRGGKQWAAAAAVALALGLVALVTTRGPDSVMESPAIAAVSEQPAAAPLALVGTGAAEPMALTPADYNVPVRVPVNRQSQENRARLNRYLVQHISTTGPRQGVMTYRNVGVSQPDTQR